MRGEPSGDTFALRIAARDWWTANHRLHHMDRARRAKAVRLSSMWVASQHLRRFDRANVLVTVRMPTRRRFDPDNAAPVAKAAIDGIVDAGILPDDDAHHRPATTYRLGEPTGVKGVHILEFLLSDITEEIPL